MGEHPKILHIASLSRHSVVYSESAARATSRLVIVGGALVCLLLVVVGLLRPALAAVPTARGRMELETIRKSIVEGLGLERIPDLSKANVSQTEYERAHKEYLSRLQMTKTPRDRRRRQLLHTFHPAEPIAPGRLYFPSLEIPENSSLDQAVLRLLLHPDSDDHQANISIYRLAPGATSDPPEIFLRETIFGGSRWIEFDLTSVIDDDKLELQLHVDRASFSSVYLNVFTTHEEQSGMRRPRAVPDRLLSLHKGRRTECRGENKKCCRHQMTVTFKDLKGFEFIVQPKSFDAGYCKGRCPPRYNPAHHHALLQSLIWKEDRRKAPRPCCAPSKLTELEILYFDENDPTKLKVSSWKNMRVLECACS